MLVCPDVKFGAVMALGSCDAGGLSASEIGKEIGEHAKHADGHDRRSRLISVIEATLLSVVALLAAWSGYAAAKWSTESRVELATASSLRIDGSRADSDAGELRDFDSSAFESWFRPTSRATRPRCGWQNTGSGPLSRSRSMPARDEAGDEPRSPAGPHIHAAVQRPGETEARALDARAKAAFLDGEKDGSTADKYIRLTVVLASILFLVGISNTSLTGASATA